MTMTKEMAERNEVVEEHPEDRKMRLEGERFGREHAEEFVSEHAASVNSLIGTYADVRAEDELQRLREIFWGGWKPKSRR
jgi:hypothetical protein